MGGYGSGKRAWHTRKTTVEGCLALPVGLFKQGLSHGPGWGGTVQWSQGDKVTGWIGYRTVVASCGTGVGIRLTYTTTDRRSGEKTESDYVIETTSTLPYFGGRRRWFLCPSCGRRCGKLYNPPGSVWFACRLCFKLTYTSCQESHKWDRLYKELAAGMDWDWRQVKHGLENRY